MANSIDVAFVKQFQGDVHEAYQRQGSKLRGMVRSKGNIVGYSTTFQKVGKGVAVRKARNAVIPPMNTDHSVVECYLEDWYAGDWVDKLDELKVQIDERQVVANASAYALGRKTDEIITTALEQTPASQNAGGGGDGLTLEKILLGFEKLNTGEIPDDGRRFGVVGARQWNELLKIEQFANADYVSDADLPWKSGAAQVKQWLGIYWMMFTGLPKTGNIRSNFMFHGDSVGVAWGLDVTSDITWHGDRAAHFVNNMMSQGACLIDDTGVVRIPALEA